jgi:hypothetical protein
MLVIGLPALFVALAVLAGLWRDTGRDLRPRGAAREVPSA